MPQPDFQGGRKHLSVLLAVGGMFFSCQTAPKLVDYPIAQTPTEFHQIENAPIVVVGSVITDRPVRGPQKSHWNPDVEFLLQKVELDVENILRGSSLPRRMFIYYFRFYSSTDGPMPLGRWEKGKRRLIFIRRDGGVLRLACDGWNYCAALVATGAHPDFKADPHQPLDAALAEILLTKGEGVSDSDFAAAIDRNAEKIPKQYAVPKLQILAASTNQDIHETACYTLKNLFNLPCANTAKQTRN